MSEFIALPNVDGDAFVLRRQSKWDWTRRTILVDGGRDPEALLEALDHARRWRFGATPSDVDFDVVAITHGDQDHTVGPLALLSARTPSGGYQWSVGEIWLPAAWSTLLHEMLPNPERFLRDVASTCRERPREVGKILQAFPAFDAESAADDASVDAEVDAPEDASDDVPDTVEALEQGHRPRSASERTSSFTEDGPAEFNLSQDAESASDPVDPDDVSLLGDVELDAMASSMVARLEASDVAAIDARIAVHLARVLDEFATLAVDPALTPTRRPHPMARAAANIIRIAALAVSRRVKIRWFDIAPFLLGDPPAGGWDNVLEPVNAVRVWPRRGGRVLVPAAAAHLAGRDRALGMVLRLAAASLAMPNAYGLVFLAPPVAGCQAPVLFCGDSHLSKPRRNPGQRSRGWPQPASLRGVDHSEVLVTAPHHGSPTNQSAYGVLKRWLDGAAPMLVRGTSSDVPDIARGFLAAHHRRCTCCGPWDPASSRAVVARSGPWFPMMTIHWRWSGPTSFHCDCR